MVGKESNAGATPDMLLRAGRLGIGTSNVNHERVVQGNDPVFQIRDDQQDNSGAAARIELLERAGGNFNGGGYIWWNGKTNRLIFGTKNSGNDTNVMVIDRASNRPQAVATRCSPAYLSASSMSFNGER